MSVCSILLTLSTYSSFFTTFPSSSGNQPHHTVFHTDRISEWTHSALPWIRTLFSIFCNCCTMSNNPCLESWTKGAERISSRNIPILGSSRTILGTIGFIHCLLEIWSHSLLLCWSFTHDHSAPSSHSNEKGSPSNKYTWTKEEWMKNTLSLGNILSTIFFLHEMIEILSRIS